MHYTQCWHTDTHTHKHFVYHLLWDLQIKHSNTVTLICTNEHKWKGMLMIVYGFTVRLYGNCILLFYIYLRYYGDYDCYTLDHRILLVWRFPVTLRGLKHFRLFCYWKIINPRVPVIILLQQYVRFYSLLIKHLLTFVYANVLWWQLDQ